MGVVKNILIGIGIIILSVLIFFSSNLTGYVTETLGKNIGGIEFPVVSYILLIAGFIVLFFLIKKY